MAKYNEWLEPDNLILITSWARDGLTDEQIAHKMGISRATLWRWEKSNPEIRGALRQGRERADIEVENALFKRAVGYESTEITETLSNGKQIRRTRRKYVPGDVKAQIFWLRNRKPNVWRDKPECSFPGAMDSTNPLEDLTTDELRTLLRIFQDDE